MKDASSPKNQVLQTHSQVYSAVRAAAYEELNCHTLY